MRAVYFFLLFILAAAVVAQQTWTLKRNEQGIKIYTTPEPDHIQHIKAELDFSSPITKISETIMDVGALQKWVYKCSSSQLIAKQGDSVVVYRHVTDAPWPFEDRDQVAKFTVRKDVKTGVVTISSKLVKGYPQYPGYVRIQHSEAEWKLVPQPNKVQAFYELSFDPGGNIPSWLINLFITDGPFHTFINLKKVLGES
jgi:hypothetical protein